MTGFNRLRQQRRLFSRRHKTARRTNKGLGPRASAHVTLATRDVRRASQFFAAAFGWKPLDRPGNIPRPAAWLEIALGQELHLVEVPDFTPSAFEQEYG